MKNLFFLLFLVGFIACETTTAEADKMEDNIEAETTEAELLNGEDGIYGARLTAENAVPVATLVKNFPETADSIETKVYGTVESVCQNKGCWMNITGADGEEMFVRFKDYGFFVPMDISGKKVIMEGKAFRELVAVDELRHYAEDEGKSAEEIAAITEPKEEFRFEATGVIVQ